MSDNKTEGYIFVAIGDRYLRMVENFITTLRHFGDERDVYVITEVDDDELFRSARTEFERYGTVPKITLNRYLPFDHNIFLDADSLCIGDTQHVWDLFKSKDQFIQQIGIKNDSTFHCHKYGKELGYPIPRVHGGCIYLNKNTIDESFFDWMQNVCFPNYEKILHSSPLNYKSSRPDQPIYAMAHGKWGLEPVELLETPIMTCLGVNEFLDLPMNRVQFKHRVGPPLDKNIPFAHMWAKIGTPVYNKVFKSIMEMKND